MRLRSSLFLLICFLAASVELQAQKTVLTQSEFSKKTSLAKKTGSGFVRQESKFEQYRDGKVVKASIRIKEEIDDPQLSTRYSEEVVQGEKRSSLETIYIGNIRYTRKNGGPWTKTDISRGAGSGGGPRSESIYGTGEEGFSLAYLATEERSNLYTVEPAKYLEENAELFENIMLSINPEIEPKVRMFRWKIWISNNIFFKEERVDTDLVTEQVHSRRTITHSYKPFKIEAPIP